MPANATTHRPAVAVPFADSPRREQNSPAQGAAFRSALESVGRDGEESFSDARSQHQLQGDEKRTNARFDEQRSARREERHARRADAQEARREERLETRRADEKTRQRDREAETRREKAAAERRVEKKRARREDEGHQASSSSRADKRDGVEQAEPVGELESTAIDQATQESSRGGFGSDPPVSEFAEAGGSGRSGLGIASASGGVGDQTSRSSADPKKTAQPGQASLNSGSSPLVPGLAKQAMSGSVTSADASNVAASASGVTADASLMGALAASTELEGDALGDELSPTLIDSMDSEELLPMASKLEKTLSKVAAEPLLRSNTGDASTSQNQTTGARSVETGPRGLSGGSNRAGLDGSQQPKPAVDPFVEPEPLPGSVRLRGVRGARINVPTDDGQVISARLDVHEEQVDVRLAAPEGSSQLAEQRASELRRALSSHGMELGEFDVSTSEDQRSETTSGGDRGENPSGEAKSMNGVEVDPWGRPVGVETSRGSAADGRGALLDLRL